jgi:hypothetical protein
MSQLPADRSTAADGPVADSPSTGDGIVVARLEALYRKYALESREVGYGPTPEKDEMSEVLYGFAEWLLVSAVETSS